MWAHKRKVVSLVLAALLVLSVTATAFAAAYDVTDTTTGTVYGMWDYAEDTGLLFDMVEEPAKYTIEVGGKQYKLNDVLAVMEANEDISIDDAVVGLVPVDEEEEELEVVSVSAINKTTIKVEFNKEVDKTKAENITNYTLSDPSATVLPLASVPLTTNSSATLLADKKTVIISLGNVDVPNGMAVAPLYLTVNDGNTTPANSSITDLAGNVLPKTVVQFTGSGTAATEAPQLQAVTYDSQNGKLTFKFDVVMSVNQTTVSGITVKNETTSVALGTGDVVTSVANGNTVEITLAAAKKSTVNGLGEAIKVDVAANSFKDTASPANGNLAVTDMAVDIAPAFVSATYNQATKELTYTFNKDINIASVTDITKFGFKVNGAANNLTITGTAADRDTLTTTANGKTITFVLGNTSQSAIEVAGATYAATLAAGAVKDLSGVQNAAVTNGTLTYTADSSAPTVTAAEFKDISANVTTDFLYITFSKNMSAAGIDATKIALSWTNDNGTTGSVAGAGATVSGKTVKVSFAAVNTIEAKTVNRATIKLVLNKDHGLKDSAGVAVANIAVTDNVMVTYTDQRAPELEYGAANNITNDLVAAGNKANPGTTASKTSLKVVFTDKVDASTIVPANFTVALDANPAVTLGVTKATLLSDGYTVLLETADQSAYAGQLLRVTVSNVKDAAGNAIVTTPGANNVGYITASGTGAAAPAMTSVVFTDANSNNTRDQGDKITVGFDKPIQVRPGLTGLTLDNVFVLSANSFGIGATVAIQAPDKAVVTLGANPTIVLGTDKINLKTGQNEIVGLDNAAATSAGAVTVPYPTTSANPKISAITFIDYNGGTPNGKADAGDKVEIKFDRPINVAANSTLANVIEADKLGAGKPFGDNSAVAIALKSGTNDTIEVTLGNAPGFDYSTDAIKGLTVGDGSNTAVTDKWGQKMDALGTGINATRYVTAAPTITSVKLVDANSNGQVDAGEKIEITVDQAVAASATDVAEIALTSGLSTIYCDNTTKGDAIAQSATNFRVIELTVGATSDLRGLNVKDGFVYFNIDATKGATGNVDCIINAYGKAVVAPAPNSMRVTIK